MPVLYHAYHTRSSSLVTLIDELGADVGIRDVSVRRGDGSGAVDPANPHPEGKVPYLVDGDEHLRERGAIMLYLTDRYPEAGLGPVHGAPGRGAYLSWLSYYQGVMEPLLLLRVAGLSHPVIGETLRDVDTMTARLAEALERGPWLLGERFSAADLLCVSPFGWLPDLIPDHPAIRDWVRRCEERPAAQRTRARDAASAARVAEMA
ncbi:glutathione S-transferase [Pararhodobacter marinus]|uniref:Glutathione S-transferase n=1 Tax=Pararhodobacter marinus TaxID=2184063 RepID=A0A2U2CG46_9RHOB|nr:glutathione S-transferase family protein [Pararhodobacter marinus]PWE30873.1 glutathione S-transferase [Pararhodobacter marinus]